MFIKQMFINLGHTWIQGNRNHHMERSKQFKRDTKSQK